MDAITTLPEGLPELTLGDGVLAWCDDYVRQPDGPDAGTRWQFTDEQVRFVLWWYAVDERGRFLFTRGVLRRAKGWGKSPLLAALALAELCGPVRFEALDSEAPGGVVGRAEAMPWVQLAGVSEKQTQNTMSVVLAMIGESPIVDDYRLDPGLTRIFMDGHRGKLEPITASAPTAEGARPTFVVEDETHWWLDGNGGVKLDAVNRRNVGKSRGGAARVLETTNAHAIGANSVAERSHKAFLASAPGRGLLYDSREAPADIDLDSPDLKAALEAAYGDSHWIDLERILDEIRDLSTAPSDSRRFYLNQVADADDSLLSTHEWAACQAAEGDAPIVDGDTITLGFDGSRGRAKGKPDATALIGCRVSDGRLFEVGVWEVAEGPGQEDWTPPLVEIEAAIEDTFKRYRVVGFHADPGRDWRSHVNVWEAKHGSSIPTKMRVKTDHPFEWWMLSGRSGLVQQAVEQFEGAVRNRDLSHDGSYRLTQHVLNSRRRIANGKLRLAKESDNSPRKIDAAVAAVLAFDARARAVALGFKTDKRRSRRLAY